MDLAAVFLLSLLGGYSFALLWRLTRFSTRRVDGHHLYFRAALLGAAFFVVALLLRTFVLPRIPGYLPLDDALIEYVKPALKEETGIGVAEQTRRAQWLVAAGYSLVIAPVCAVFLNMFTPRRWAQRRGLDALDRMLLLGQEASVPIQQQDQKPPPQELSVEIKRSARTNAAAAKTAVVTPIST